MVDLRNSLFLGHQLVFFGSLDCGEVVTYQEFLFLHGKTLFGLLKLPFASPLCLFFLGESRFHLFDLTSDELLFQLSRLLRSLQMLLSLQVLILDQLQLTLLVFF